MCAVDTGSLSAPAGGMAGPMRWIISTLLRRTNYEYLLLIVPRARQTTTYSASALESSTQRDLFGFLSSTVDSICFRPTILPPEMLLYTDFSANAELVLCTRKNRTSRHRAPSRDSEMCCYDQQQAVPDAQRGKGTGGVSLLKTGKLYSQICGVTFSWQRTETMQPTNYAHPPYA